MRAAFRGCWLSSKASQTGRLPPGGGRVVAREVAWYLPDAVAKLNIEARGGRVALPGGGGERVALVVSVTDEAGRPVTDLLPDDFLVRAVALGSPDPEISLNGASARGEGVYLLDVAAAQGWGAGRSVLLVAVRRVFERGQCLAEIAVG